MTKFKFSDKDDGDAWEQGDAGLSAAHVQAAPPEIEKAIDDGLDLAPVTMRLQKSLVEQLKELASRNGLGYQPFVRQILTQYVREHADQITPAGAR
jgi:hypothetical protein